MPRTIRALLSLLILCALGAPLARSQNLPSPTYKAISSDMGASITMSGAKCDGTTDDTTAINNYLATFTRGGLVVVPANRMCLINSGNLTIPIGVIVEGAALPLVSKNTSTFSAGFYINPAFTVVMQTNAELRNLKIWRSGLLANPTNAQVLAAVQQWGSETSAGVNVQGDWVRLEHLFIIGFNTCIYNSGHGTYIFSDILGDCYNGLFITAAASNSAMHDIRFAPFYAINSNAATAGSSYQVSANQGSPGTTIQFSAGTISNMQTGDYAAIATGTNTGKITLGTTVVSANNSTGAVVLSSSTTAALNSGDWVQIGGSWDRPGVGYFAQGNGGNSTGWYMQRILSYMFHYGLIIADTGVGYVSDGDFEFNGWLSPDTSTFGTAGVKVLGHNSNLNISNTSASGQAIGIQVDLSPLIHLNNFTMGNPDFVSGPNVSGANAVTGHYYGGAPGTGTAITLSGTPNVGDSATITVNGTAFTYAAVSGDNLTKMLTVLDRMIASNPALTAAHISPLWANNTISFYAPAATTLTVTASGTGNITTSSAAASSQVGSWVVANVIGWVGATNIPAVTVGANATAITMSGLPPGNNGGLVSGEISIASPNPAVQIVAMPAVPITSGNLTSCGSGQVASTGATDQMGTITEGTSATGCTLTFRTPYPQTPVCIISSPNGAPWTGYTVSTTALTITNTSASGNQYAYLCHP